nr:MAG TPA: hypothetical protein [Caudoviricetes sp.]
MRTGEDTARRKPRLTPIRTYSRKVKRGQCRRWIWRCSGG